MKNKFIEYIADTWDIVWKDRAEFRNFLIRLNAAKDKREMTIRLCQRKAGLK